MGDHLICAGLVRRLALDYALLMVVVHAPYMASFQRLFGDVANVRAFVVDTEARLAGADAALTAGGVQVLRVGYHKDDVGGVRGSGDRQRSTDAAIARGLSFAEVV